jgi:hypothetical protein
MAESESKAVAMFASKLGNADNGGVCVAGMERLLGESCEINDLKHEPLGHPSNLWENRQPLCELGTRKTRGIGHHI